MVRSSRRDFISGEIKSLLSVRVVDGNLIVWCISLTLNAPYAPQPMLPEVRHRLSNRPPLTKSGESAFALPQALIDQRDEVALTISLITRRQRFGLVYWGLQPDYFDLMPRDSGVYLTLLIRTSALSVQHTVPGDIDLLIVPYECDELVLSRTIALEVKAVRASFLRQGKSPNEFGFSQARGLQEIGFPYVGLAHLIVSDESPVDAYREMGIFRAVGNDGRVERLAPKRVDCLPMDLIARTYGRLEKAAVGNPDIGLVAAYMGSSESDIMGGGPILSFWTPTCRRAERNPLMNAKLLQRVADLVETYPDYFFDCPRFPPKR